MNFIKQLLFDIVEVITFSVKNLSDNFDVVLPITVTMVAFFASVYVLIDVIYFLEEKKK